MRTTRQAAIRGAGIGAAVTLPMGLVAGMYLRDVLFGGARSGQTTAFVVMVTVAFVAWGVFIGGMLSAEAHGARSR